MINWLCWKVWPTVFRLRAKTSKFNRFEEFLFDRAIKHRASVHKKRFDNASII